MTNNKSRHAKRVLHDLRISEVSAVDAGAAQGAKIVLLKRLKRDRSAALLHKFNKIFGVRKSTTFGGYPAPSRKNLDVVADPDAPINPGGSDDGDENDADDENKDNELDELTDDITRNRKVSTMKRSEELSAIVKRHGLIAVAKQLCEDPHGVSEHEFTQAIVDHAQRVGSTFSKVYCGNDADAITLRKAIQTIKYRQFAEQYG